MTALEDGRERTVRVDHDVAHHPPPSCRTRLVELGINVIRGLAMDAPEAAHSGHSGTAMALAPLAHVLWTRIMRYDPQRSRVARPGPLRPLQRARLHPAVRHAAPDRLRPLARGPAPVPPVGQPDAGPPRGPATRPGIEVTTGPLGQGFANAVGMALAERLVRSRFGSEVCDHRTFVIAGDGCLMEGISHEAASLAGHLGLGRLLAFYDDNHITIDGPTELAYDDDVAGRFEAYGWHVRNLGEMANDVDGLEAAIREALAQPADGPDAKPTLLVLRSHIGWPSPQPHRHRQGPRQPLRRRGDPRDQGDPRACRPTRRSGCPTRSATSTPRRSGEASVPTPSGTARFESWDGDRGAWDAAQAGHGLAGWADGPAPLRGGDHAGHPARRQPVHRRHGRAHARAWWPARPTSPGTTASWSRARRSSRGRTPGGIQVHYGIREHGMGGVMNGMAAHGGVLPVGGTFFVFSDYMRPARCGWPRSARPTSSTRGPTTPSDWARTGRRTSRSSTWPRCAPCRALSLVRPADANETAQAWRLAVEADGPVGLVLTRQDIPVLAETADRGCRRRRAGGYVLVDTERVPEIVLVGTGSEVQHCLAAAGRLAGSGVQARVVSFPCWDVVRAAGRGLPGGRASRPGCPCSASRPARPSAGSATPTTRSASTTSAASAPGAVVMEKFGFTRRARGRAGPGPAWTADGG